ncbi:MAG TPA: hypothetical protein DCS21_01950, partial [Gammaproteobacteria bacterium]|nr:hypothetical protein [Gammaproteobacteria bacterium]
MSSPTVAHIPRQLPLRIHIATLFITLILILGGAVIWNDHIGTTRLMLQAEDERFERIADRTSQYLHNLFTPVVITVELLGWQKLVQATSLEERLTSLPYLRKALEQAPHLSALFIGYDDGDFFLLRPLPDDSPLRQTLNTPESARYLVQSMERDAPGAATGTYLFYDAQLNVLHRELRPDYQFDPRQRPWYQMALGQVERTYTESYLFFTTHEVGATLAQRTAAGTSVVGADLTLRQISTVLATSRFLPSA